MKSFDPRKHRVVEPGHVLQVQVQVGLWNEIHKKKLAGGLLLYVNASNFQDLREVEVRPDPAAYGAAHERARTIMTETSPAALPAEGRIAGGRECARCPFQRACLGAAIEDKGRLSEDEQSRLAALKAEAEAAEDEIKALERRVAAAKEAARDILRAADVRRAPGLASVRRSRRVGALDTEAMERDGIVVAP